MHALKFAAMPQRKLVTERKSQWCSGASETIFRLHLRSQSRRETADKLLDAGQDRLLIAREGPVIGAVELDESRLRDVAGEIPAGADANGAVAATVEHQGRSGDPAQEMPHIGVAHRLQHTHNSSRARRGPEHSCPPGSRLR